MANIFLSTQRLQLFPGAQTSATVDITNVGQAPVMFRMLTTCPSRYSVMNKRGVIRPNAVTHVVISLNDSEDNGIPQASAESREFIKDTFLLEYATVGPNDVVAPDNTNVTALLAQKKKTGEASSKMISSRVYLRASGSNGGSAAPRHSRMTPMEAQAHTLAEKAKRQHQTEVVRSNQFLWIAVVVVAIAAAFLTYHGHS
eukprot:gene12031-8284_t